MLFIVKTHGANTAHRTATMLVFLALTAVVVLGGPGCTATVDGPPADGSPVDDGATTLDGAVGPDGAPDADAASRDSSVPRDGATPMDGSLYLPGSPVLSNFRTTGENLGRIYFDSSESIRGGTATGFTVHGKTITAVSVAPDSTSGHYFTVGSPFDFWDNNAIRYEGGSDIEDVDGNTLHAFTLHYIDSTIPEPLAPMDRYVTVSGAGSHDGSLGNEWTLAEACANATAGMTVHIERGDYGDRSYVVANDGTAAAPIKFEGYQNIPGDRPSLPFVNTTTFSAAEMPYVHSAGRSNSGFSIQDRKYVVVRNIQVEGYEYSINIVRSSYAVLDNVYAREGHGTIYGLSTGNLAGTNQRIINSYASNATGWGIVTSGVRHLVEDSYISSSYNVGMDYSISLNGCRTPGSGHHIIRGNEIYHSALETNHRGHGITLYGIHPHDRSLVENCTLTNIRQNLEARRNLVNDGVWRDIDVLSDGYTGTVAILISSARRHVFDNIRQENGELAVQFYIAGDEHDPGAVDKGRDNLIINSAFSNILRGVSIDEDPDGADRTLYGNTIANCTFSGLAHFFLTDSTTTVGPGNTIRNSIISDTPDFKHSRFTDYPEIFTFQESNFWDYWAANGAAPSREGNLSIDPQFVDLVDLVPRNRTLKAGRSIPGVEYDRDGVERENPPTIGAVEID